MADLKISAATAVVTPAATDQYATNQGSASKRTTLQQILDFTRENEDYWIRQAAGYTLVDSIAAQKLFNATANGRLTIVSGVYSFDFNVVVTAMSATSGNALIGIVGLGTATTTAWLWLSNGQDQNTVNTTGTKSGGAFTASDSAASVVTAAAGTSLIVQATGTFDCTVGGTLIPAITLVTGGVTPLVNVGSFLRVRRLGATGAVSVGAWD